MRRYVQLVVAVLTVASLGASAIFAETAFADEPEGYRRVNVKKAGLSILIPDSFRIERWTRKEAKKFIAANPDLAEEGVTVERLVSQPLLAQIDEDGDRFPDESIAIEGPFRGVGLPAPSALRRDLAGRYRGVTVRRTTVAGNDALVADFAWDVPRADRTSRTVSETDFLFRVGDSNEFVRLQFQRDPNDVAFDETIDTISNRVRTLR